MSTKPAETAAVPPKSKSKKKMLVIVVAAVLVLVLAGGGAWLYISQQRAAAMQAEDEGAVAEPAAKGPPTYLPLDSMVVNLADPGGEKVAQIGITLELADSASTEKVKQYLPTIRSGVLLLVSQRTSEELLQREGKEKLAKDILIEASRPFGGGEEQAQGAGAGKKTAKKKKGLEELPVQRVLFSSFIVQ